MQSSTAVTMDNQIASLAKLDKVQLMIRVSELQLQLENEQKEHQKTFTKYQDCDMELCEAENNLRQGRRVIQYQQEKMKALGHQIRLINEERERDAKDDYKAINNLKSSVIGKQIEIERLEIIVKANRPDSKDERIKELEAEVKKLKIGGPIQDQARFKILTDDNNELGRQVVDLRSLYVDVVEREEAVKSGYRAQIMELRGQLGQPMAPYSPQPVYFEPMPVQMIHCGPQYLRNPQELAPALYESAPQDPQAIVQYGPIMEQHPQENTQSPSHFSQEYYTGTSSESSQDGVYPPDIPEYSPEDYQRFADLHAAKAARKNHLAKEMKDLEEMIRGVSVGENKEN